MVILRRSPTTLEALLDEPPTARWLARAGAHDAGNGSALGGRTSLHFRSWRRLEPTKRSADEKSIRSSPPARTRMLWVSYPGVVSVDRVASLTAMSNGLSGAFCMIW